MSSTSGPAAPPPSPSPDATPQDEAQDRERRRSGARIGEIAAFVSAVTAVLGLLLAFFGLPAAFNSPAAKTATRTVDVTESVSAPPTPERTTTSPTPSASGSPTSPAASDGPAVPPQSRTHVIELPKDYGFRLADNPVVVEEFGGLDFYRDANSFRNIYDNGQEGRIAVLHPGESADSEGCRSVTRFVDLVSLEGLRSGARMCLTSPQGVIALAEVVQNTYGKDPDYGFLKLRLTLWDH
ncbi:hypothetical protein [Streptomyces sp. NPDC054787]